MTEYRSPLLEQFEQAVVDNERARRDYQRWQDMDKGCNRGPDCILCRGIKDKRRACERTAHRVRTLRKHLVNALEHQIDSARDYRAIVKTEE